MAKNQNMPMILDRFKLGEQLRKCTYSTIYAAADLNVRRSCLCKVYEYSEFLPHEMAALHREVALIKKLRHPLLIYYISILHDHRNKRYYLFMEDIQQETLAQYIERRKQLDRGSHVSERNVWYIFSQLIDLMNYLHEFQTDDGSPALLHSLTTESIFIDKFDMMAVNFFSLSRKVFKHVCYQHRTPEYRAPEHLRTGIASKRSDMWSLGAILYEICTFTPFCVSLNPMDAVQKLGKARRKVPIPRYSNTLVATINNLLELMPECRMPAEALMAHKIIHEMIRAFWARLGNYGHDDAEQAKLLAKPVEQNSKHSSKQASIDSSIHSLNQQLSIDSGHSIDIDTQHGQGASKADGSLTTRYNDVLLHGFANKCNCSIIDDRPASHQDNSIGPRSHIFRSSYEYISVYDRGLSPGIGPKVSKSDRTIDMSGSSDVSTTEQVVSGWKHDLLDPVLYSVSTPYLSQSSAAANSLM